MLRLTQGLFTATVHFGGRIGPVFRLAYKKVTHDELQGTSVWRHVLLRNY